MRFRYNDGGRAEAGFKGEADDCVCRAIAIATQLPYRDVYNLINRLGKAERPKKRGQRSSARNGVYTETLRATLAELGWTWIPTMGIGTGCTVHLREDELPSGRLVVQVSRHIVAVINGVVYDKIDPRRGGNRCVYGYWTK